LRIIAKPNGSKDITTLAVGQEEVSRYSRLDAPSKWNFLLQTAGANALVPNDIHNYDDNSNSASINFDLGGQFSFDEELENGG
jgi:hypothetical protein